MLDKFSANLINYVPQRMQPSFFIGEFFFLAISTR